MDCLMAHLCEAGAAAFNAVERLVHLVGTVDVEIELRSAGTHSVGHSDGHTHILMVETKREIERDKRKGVATYDWVELEICEGKATLVDQLTSLRSTQF